jgi:hypothetical protein
MKCWEDAALLELVGHWHLLTLSVRDAIMELVRGGLRSAGIVAAMVGSLARRRFDIAGLRGRSIQVIRRRRSFGIG